MPPKIKLNNKKPIYIKFAQNIDFFDLFKKIEKVFDNCYILESLGQDGSRSRYHIIGFDPEEIISAKKNRLKIQNKNGKYIYDKNVENPYYALREIMPQEAITRQYAGGLLGYLGYDCVNYFEPSINVLLNKKFDQFKFGVYKDGLIYDKITGEIYYFYFNKNRFDLIKKISKEKFLPVKKLKIDFVKNTKTKKEYADIIRSVKNEILAGKIFQSVVGFKTEFNIMGDDILIYEKLRRINPSPFMYYIKFGNEKIIGASPELLFRLRQNEIETFPLAGSIKRGKTKNEDKELARQLLNDPKERAEHSMLIDLHRNDIGRVAKFGTVRVKNIMDIKKFSHIQHISSEVSGVIKNGEDMFSALASNFPAGTLSGAPKIEAMKIIDREENEPRGVYGGAVGHFGFNNECSFAIPIRSLFIFGEYAYTQTGSGIVYDSSIKNEYQEIINKMAAMRKTLSKFE
ncbi:MAG: anthranilate synthase component I family protein [Patescibacteria group bacterium]|nr:anthranilate synthase component I family protein [Patescibacteria group bacterium]